MVYGLYNWFDKIKRYFRFSKQELLGLLVSVLIFGMLFGIDDKTGLDKISTFWYQNLVSMILIVALAAIVHVSVQKIYALKLGFKADYKVWYLGLVVSMIITLVSRAYIIVLLPGMVSLHLMSKHRLGYFHYGRDMGTLAMVSLSGPLANLALALLFFALRSVFPGNMLIEAAVLINVWYAIFTILPIPYTDGMNVFYGNFYAYFFSLGLIVGVGALLLLNLALSITMNLISILFLSAIVGLGAMLVLSLFYNKLADIKRS